MGVKTVEYFEARITALYSQLEELESSPVEEYQTDNAGQRMQVRYRKMDEIRKQIAYYEGKISKINSRGGRALVRFRRGC